MAFPDPSLLEPLKDRILDLAHVRGLTIFAALNAKNVDCERMAWLLDFCFLCLSLHEPIN